MLQMFFVCFSFVVNNYFGAYLPTVTVSRLCTLLITVIRVR